MSEIEKLIELFKNCDKVKFIVSGCGEEEHKTIEFKTAIEALEEKQKREQGSQKALDMGSADEFGYYGNAFLCGICPVCKNRHIISEYCPDCGQKLDWSGDNE